MKRSYLGLRSTIICVSCIPALDVVFGAIKRATLHVSASHHVLSYIAISAAAYYRSPYTVRPSPTNPPTNHPSTTIATTTTVECHPRAVWCGCRTTMIIITIINIINNDDWSPTVNTRNENRPCRTLATNGVHDIIMWYYYL